MKLFFPLIITFLLLSYSSVEAQDQEIHWTKSLKNKGEIYPIGEYDGHFYMIRRSLFQIYLEKTNVQTMEIVYSEKMDGSHPDAPTKIMVGKAILNEGIINLFGMTVDQKSGKSVLWTSSIKTNGIITKKWSPVHISEIELSPYDYDIKMSPDGAYFSWRFAFNEDPISMFKWITFDKEFNKVSSGEIMIPAGQSQRKITGLEVTNSGHVFALVGSNPLYRLNIENNSLIPSKSGGNTYDPGKLGPVTLYVFDGVTEQHIALNKDDDRITLLNGTLSQDSSGSTMYFTGLYSSKHGEERIKGTYLAKLSADQDYPNFVFSELGEDFAIELVQKNLTFKHEKDLAAYQVRETRIDHDGNVLIIGEFIHYLYYCWSAGGTTKTSGCTYDVNWNSIFIIKLTKDGSLLWKSILPKKSSKLELLAELTQSFAYRNTEKGTDILFLDEKGNLLKDGVRINYGDMKNPKKRPVLVRAHIDNNGDITYTTFLIMTGKSKTPYLFKGSWQIGDAILIDGISGINSAKQHLGRIDLK